MANPVGRPTKYKPEYCEMVIEFADKGKSINQFSSFIQVNRSSIYEWAKKHEEFSNALTYAKELCESFWETEIQKMMYSKEVNAPLVKLYMANRFGWSDKSQVENSHKVVDSGDGEW